MDRPLISVIIPIYNSEKYLDQCLESVIHQTYRNLEILLINDGSTDDSLAICQKFAHRDERIKIISKKNEGLIAARKTGIMNATADLIGFVDSDDWIEENMYERLVGIFLETDCDLVSSGIYRDYVDEFRTIEVCDNFKEGLYSDIRNSVFPTMIWNDEKKDFGLYCTLVNKLYRKTLLQEVYHSINTNIFYGEDCLTLFSYVMYSKTIYIFQSSFYHYNIRNGSMCRTVNDKLLYNTYLLYSELKKIFMSQGSKAFILLRQLRRYILEVESHTLRMLYDINVTALGNWNFSYEEVKDRKVIIYGAGGCGQALYKYLQKNSNSTEIVAWVDKSPKGKAEQCLYEIVSPDKILNLKYDYVIIAVLEETLALRIREELICNYAVQDKRILWKKAEYISIFDTV